MTTRRFRSRQSCPHCEGPLKIQTVQKVTPTFFDYYLVCAGEMECGWRGVANLSFARTIIQSGIANPLIKLPLSAPRPRQSRLTVSANEDAPTFVAATH